MAEEKEYIVEFINGMVRRMTGQLSAIQKLPVKSIKEVLPSINPANIVSKDMERIAKAFGQVLKPFQNGTGFLKPPFGSGFFKGG